ncbi:MAG: shikimate dehydrogenase [Thaumarchaeota archaeon]|jgi:sialic acid synthase SpsE|nr:MAG: shikimate dehydrogenase [Nitrososphaerota archaeon]
MKAFIVAEIASNWEGSISKAKKLILNCKNAGADAVKFQIWRAEDLYEKDHLEWKNIVKSELSFKKIKILKIYCDSIGIEFFASVFYPEAVDFLESIKVKRYKIASRTCTLKDPYSIETIEKIGTTRKPTIISMGMGGNKKIIKQKIIKNKEQFCYCISKYPTKISEINWKNAVKYNGFSDHTLGSTAPLIFTVLHKQKGTKNIFIEKHVKNKNSKGPDASSSMTTEKFKEMISAIRDIEKLSI